ncbi:MAG: DUF1565 domain-containing protein [bacterium]
MKTRLLFLLMILLVRYSPVLGQNIEIRVSIKVIVHPRTGARPVGITDIMLNTAGANANNWMASYWRGYRFRITEIINIGGPLQGGSSGPSKWFDKDPRNDTDWPVFQNDIKTDPLYLLRSNQVNFYITGGPSSNSGGACPIADYPLDAGYPACQAYVNSGAFWLVHETGHYFGLCHTFDACGVLGTLPEGPDWTRDQIAMNSYGLPYNSLNSAQKKLVDDTYFNVMAYHNVSTKDSVQNRMTELQHDRHTDKANSTRAAVVSGRTQFVSLSGSDAGAGSSNSPYRTVAKAVTAANAAGGDIILLRPGAYNEILTLTKPVTLRATRTGAVAIGTSSVSASVVAVDSK